MLSWKTEQSLKDSTTTSSKNNEDAMRSHSEAKIENFRKHYRKDQSSVQNYC